MNFNRKLNKKNRLLQISRALENNIKLKIRNYKKNMLNSNRKKMSKPIILNLILMAMLVQKRKKNS